MIQLPSRLTFEYSPTACPVLSPNPDRNNQNSTAPPEKCLVKSLIIIHLRHWCGMNCRGHPPSPPCDLRTLFKYGEVSKDYSA